MRLRVIAVGTRMPRWVDDTVADYARRLGPRLELAVQEIPTGGRGGSKASGMADEGERLLAKLREGEFVVALDERGHELSSRELATWLAARQQDGCDLAFVIGGPDGLAPAVRERCDFLWSLSRLTLPHALVRVVVAEQLYRAHTVLTGHPYHRD